MAQEKVYFDLTLDTLRSLGGWAAACASRVLSVSEDATGGDPRPRDALEAIQTFAGGGRRTARLRVVALAAYRASLTTADPAASAAARSASLAAASAYTHPLADVGQTQHILGPAAYAVLARELQNPSASEAEVRAALETVPPEVCGLLAQMPRRSPGKTRIDRILYDLDGALRSGASS